MKKTVLLLLTLLCISSFAQPRPAAFDKIMSSPQYAYLEYRDYPEPSGSVAAAPRGFKPVYISHYGRHGARFHYLNGKYEALADFFGKVLASDAATSEGRALAEKYMAAYPYFKNRAGDLTGKGVRQHQGIAGRMYRNYKEVFRSKPHLDARSSTTQRSIMSMVAFCDVLEQSNRKIRIDKETSEAYLHILNPHHGLLPFADIAREGKKPYSKAWTEESKALRKRLTPGDEFLGKYFSDLDWVEANFGKRKLVTELYTLMVSTECTEVPYHFTELFSTEQLLGFWELTNLLYYHKWGPGEDHKNFSYYMGAYLLDDIMDCADKDLAEGNLGARLRFGHDVAIGMVLTLMGIEGWNKGVSHPDEVKYVYDFSNVPMAANIQFIFYRNRRGETLVRMMLDECDLTLPLPSDNAPYYRWEDFTSHYRKVTAGAIEKMDAILK